MSKLKAGVIGAGVFGAHHASKYKNDPRVELIGVYDMDTERMDALAETLSVRRFNNMDDMLDLLDIVTVASPPMTHASAAAAALEYNKHVLIEKPIAVSMVEAELLLQVAELNKRVLACGHQERLVFEAMGLFSAAERPTLIESTREGPWTGRSTDVSVALDLMVHDFDLARTIAGAAPSTVSAQGKAVHAASADAMTAELRFEGLTARFTGSRVAEARKRTMRIVYPSGELNIDFLARTFSNTSKVALDPSFGKAPAGRDPLGANVARFIDAVLGAAPRPAVTGREAADALKIALDADKAAGLPSLSFA
ncbi:MAG: Gfo/Idh/MocA family oxidoreductase [Hyphomonadaceae bacterium]|nr:Gfo/Idh/MocA family oxidoreductase [Hyphomonadaceae bacterium]